jgi:competence protein ComFC
MASHLSNDLNIQNASYLGRKTNNRQFGATRVNRLKQMEDEFFIKSNREVLGKNIVLVDDVVTTGATLSSCAKILKKAGAKSVSAIVFAQKI